MSSVFVVISGIFAAGKSSVARGVAAELGKAVHVEGDVFGRMIVSGREVMSPEAGPEARRQLELRYELAIAAGERYHAAGYHVVLEDVILGDDLGALLAAVTARPLVPVVLAPSPAVAEARDAARDKHAYYDSAWTAEALAVSLPDPGLAIHIDSTRQSLDETIAQVLALAREAGHV